MIEDKDVAAKLSNLLLEASGALNEAAQIIGSSGCTPEEKRTLFLAIGGAMGKIGTEILNPLYRSHPDLKPKDFLLPEET